MKNLLLLLPILFPWILQGQYILEINGQALEIATDRKYEIVIDGQPVTFELREKDTLLFEEEFFSFQYLRNTAFSRAPAEEGIEQIMLVTADGACFLIQIYSDMNPEKLNEFMLSEMTKESVYYGYELHREDYQRTLLSGQTIDVNKAVLTYQDEIGIYEVASIGHKNGGILIVSMPVDEIPGEQARQAIDLFWGSLTYKEKIRQHRPLFGRKS